jgi:hypothetical protein
VRRRLGGVQPLIVCYYFDREQFRAFAEREGVPMAIRDIHPRNPFVGYRFNVVFTRARRP